MKISVSSSKNSNSNKQLSFDSSSTYMFGEVQPIMCTELEANSKISANVNSIVRLGVLNCPTFGRVKYKLKGRFVPIADIYRPFENLLSQQMFNSGDKAYIPDQVPSVPLGWLSALLLNPAFADCSVYYNTSSSSVLNGYYKPYSVNLSSRCKDSYNVFRNNLSIDGLDTSDGYTSLSIPLGSRDAGTYGLFAYDMSARPGSPNLLIKLQSADFVLYSRFTQTTDSEGQSMDGRYAFAFRLNNRGRRLYKILLGCGYQIDVTSSDSVSILPLLAFFKAWFDAYKPLNTSTSNITFDSTYAHELQELIVHRNHTIVSLDDSVYNSSQELVEPPIYQSFINFILELSNCFYYQESDYVTSHISQPSLAQPLRPSVSNPTILSDFPGSGSGTNGYLPTLNGSVTGQTGIQYTTPWNVKLLLRLLPYFNKNTVVGGNIQKWLQSHGFGDFIQNSKSYGCGEFELPCSITDINSTSDTFDSSTGSGEVLGSYTGKGIGATDGDKNFGKFKYKTNTQGYFIIMACIVPVSSYSQGLNPMLFHRSKLEFYDSAFDALDFSVSRKSLLKGSREIVDQAVSGTGSTVTSPNSAPYGFIPRYSEYCYLPNILNGLMSLRSTRNTFLPYTLDKFIVPEKEYYGSVPSTVEDYDKMTDVQISSNVNLPVASPELRNIGNPVNGNYERIFYSSRLLSLSETNLRNYGEDNFIVHNQIDVDYSSGKKPLSISFETNDGGSEFEVDKE